MKFHQYITYLIERVKFQQDAEQQGSNAGGPVDITDKKNSQVNIPGYLKFNRSEDQSSVEIVASRLFRLTGLETINYSKVTVHQQTGLLSPWRKDAKRSPWLTPEVIRGLTEEQKQELAILYLACAWLKNWDGLMSNNILLSDAGHFIVIDTGGSFHFRAQGQQKPATHHDLELVPGFSINAQPEVHSMLTVAPGGKFMAKVFQGRHDLIETARHTIQRISDSKIEHAFRGVQFSSILLKKNLIETIKARRDSL